MKLDDVDLIQEASYDGNIGFSEVIMFRRRATPEQLQQFNQYVSLKKEKEAWKLVQSVTNTQLKGKEYGN